MIQVSEWVRYRVEIPGQRLIELGCYHNTPESRQPDTCLGCSIGDQLNEAIRNGLDARQEQDSVRNVRILSGRYRRDNKTSLAVMRLLAFAMGHRDPLELFDQQQPGRSQ